MNIHRERPACWTFDDTSERGIKTEGWSLGAKPGLRNPFFDNGRACGLASSAEIWHTALRLTPSCAGCARARRGLDIAAGIIEAAQ